MKGNESVPPMHLHSVDDAPQKFYTLKILFGPLFGCELHLPADDYFLIISARMANDNSFHSIESAQNHAASFTKNTLYIPCDLPSPNLLLHLSSPINGNSTEKSYLIDVQDELNSFEVTLKENEIFIHGPIRLAIKSSEEHWLDNITHFMLTRSSETEEPQQSKRYFSPVKKKAVLILCLIIVLLLLLIAIGRYSAINNESTHLSELKHALVRAPTPLNILPGRTEPLVYILAKHYQTMQWLEEALIKLNLNSSIVPIWLPQLSKDVTSQLINAGYPVLQVDYARPEAPVITLWQTLTPQQAEKFSALALTFIPFAREITTAVKTKNQLLQDAQQGLERLQIAYRQITTSSGYAFVIRDTLDDTTFVALRDFITEFYHNWGDRIITFSINLNENGLVDKSYVDATNGYLFLTPRHWYFPLNKEI